MHSNFMRELAQADLANFNALKCRQLFCRKTSIHRSASRIEQLSARFRMRRVAVVDGKQDSDKSLISFVRQRGHAARLAYDRLADYAATAVQNPDVSLLECVFANRRSAPSTDNDRRNPTKTGGSLC